MKKYTQEEFNQFEINEQGYRICPSGDYSEITVFGTNSRFGDRSIFGADSVFGACSIFGAGSVFGADSIFGAYSIFGAGSRFGACSKFGEGTIFGEPCSHEGLTNSRYIAVDKIGREQRKTYFFAADEGFFVRAGCWFGTFDEFRERVKEVHGGTRHERHYLAALDLARLMLEDEAQ